MYWLYNKFSQHPEQQLKCIPWIIETVSMSSFFISLVGECNCIAPWYQCYLRFYPKMHVCVHVINGPAARKWRKMKLCTRACVCVCVLTNGWALNIKHWAVFVSVICLNETQSFKHTPPKHHVPSRVLRHWTAADGTCSDGDSYTSACCFVHFYHHATSMPSQHRHVCLLWQTMH